MQIISHLITVSVLYALIKSNISSAEDCSSTNITLKPNIPCIVEIGMITATMYNASSSMITSKKKEEHNMVMEILNTSQLIFTSSGFVANLATFITFSISGKAFTSAIRMLLRHQAAVD